MAGEIKNTEGKSFETGSKAAEIGAKVENTVDISKRIDVGHTVADNREKGVDITKRIVPKEINNGLNSEQVKELTSKGFSPGLIKDVSYKDGVFKLNTNNQELAGMKHPITGVKYEKKVVDLFGTKIEGVFPKFEPIFTAKLPNDKLITTDHIQFKECNSQLKSAIENDSKLKGKFSKEQIEMINDGMTPRGYTWNHNEETGKMELVDSKKHSNSNHTGGKAIWGGGSSKR